MGFLGVAMLSFVCLGFSLGFPGYSELLERSARLRIVYGWVHAIGGQFQQAKQLLEGFNGRDRKEHEARIYALKAFILRGEGFVLFS